MTMEGGCGPTFEMPPGLGHSFEVWSVLSCIADPRILPWGTETVTDSE